MNIKSLFGKIEKLKYKKEIIIITLFILGLVFRLYKIDSPIADWHSFRQADTSSVSRMYLEGNLWDLLNPKYHDISRIQSGLFNPEGFRFVEFPIYNFFQALFTKYIGLFSLEIWGRLVSIISALLSSYILYLLGKRFISEAGGIVASAFFLLDPYNIYFTRVILPEPMAVLFALLSLYAFVKFIDKDKVKFIYTSGLLFAISILIKPYTIFFAVPMFFIALNKYSLKELFSKKQFLITYILALLPLVLWRFWIMKHPEGIPFWKWTLNGDGIRFKPAFWYWVFGERLTKLILGFWGIIPFAYGIIAYEKKSKLIHSFLFGMFLFVATFATANVRHDYYQSITIPAISLMFAWGFLKYWNLKDMNKILLRGVLTFSVFMVFVSGAFQVKEYYKINHPEIIEAGKAVDRLTPKNSLVVAQYFGDTAFLYQTKRRGWPNVELPIDELIEEGAEYYASVDLSSSQTKEFMQKFITLEKTDSYVVLDLNEKL